MRLISASIAFATLLAAAPALADDLPKAPPPKEEGQAAEAVKWEADFDAAVARAKAEGKDLLVDFTGSDWCGWCVRLHEEVFAKEPFSAAAGKDYVLVALDFPQGDEAKAKVPNPERNQQVAEKYGIQSFPTVLLMTPEGDVFGQTGYQQGGPEKYVEHLGKLRTGGKAALAEAVALEKALAAAKGDAQAPIVEKALAKLATLEPGAAPGGRLAKVAKAGLTLDPKDEKGLKSRIVGALLASGHADEGVVSEARAMDPKNEKALLEKVVKHDVEHLDSLEAVKAAVESVAALEATGNWKNVESRRELLAAAAYFCKKHLEDEEQAKSWARKLKVVAPKDDERLQGLLQFVLGDEAAEEPAEEPAKEPAKAPAEGPAKDPEQK